MIERFFAALFSPIVLQILHGARVSAPVWVPILLVMIWFDLWIHYKRREFISKQGFVLLEVKIPREIPKSPAAMELFLNNLYQTSAGNLLKVYLEGAVRPWFSLELVSIDGTVHFYIWMFKRFKELVQSQLYAQFPNVEVQEVADYAAPIHHDPNKYNFGWIGQFALTKADAYPIMTYVDYGLVGGTAKEGAEVKSDPISSVIEFLGSLRRGEQAWIQILVQGHTKEGLKLGRVFTKPDWKKAAEEEIKSIKEKSASKPGEPIVPMTKGDQDIIAAIQRTLAKYAFDTMIRATYFAEKDVFNGNNIGGLLGSFRQFSSNTLNGFKPDFKAGHDYPWQDFKGRRKLEEEKKLLEAYKRRSFFNPPFKNFHGKAFILTTEELATLFHFPSADVVATPTLGRIPSKKSEAPPNLPI